MSRIGKNPIEVPSKVDIQIDGQTITVKGPLGTLQRTFRPEVAIRREGNVLHVTRLNDERLSRSLHGLSRTLLNNMVVGVSQGFARQLEIVGVGYKAAVQGQKLTLTLGYSHPIEIDLPAGITVTVEANTKLTVKGFDRQLVGDIAALIRSKRKPEPYKGKGVKFAGEFIKRKAGKAGKK